MTNKINIALIDSGVSDKLLDIECDIEYVDIGLFDNQEDKLEHGSSVAYILSKSIQDIKIFSIKIFDSEYNTTEEDIIKAFRRVEENDFIDLVHFSGGTNTTNDFNIMDEVVNKLTSRGIIIVSAFENIGQCTWPAACKNVLGVKWDRYIRNINNYTYVENSRIDILGFGGIINLPKKNGEIMKVSGSSFAAPYITSKIAEIIRTENLNKKNRKINKIKFFLKKDASSYIKFKNTYTKNQIQLREKVNKIKKAIVFPFNKEIHSIVGNEDLLKFQIYKVFDIKFSGKVGKKIKDCCYCRYYNDMVIDSVENVKWEDDFDTIILGHIDMLNALKKNKYNIKYFIEKALEYNKNLYIFDDLNISKCIESKFKEKNLELMHFDINYHDNNFGCLKLLSIPVLGIIGTSSKQGKFNLQLELRRKLIGEGYKVEQLGTEPSSLLFGMDIIYSNGYGSNINSKIEDQIMYINELVWENSIEKDILLVGTQSQTIPYGYGNVGFYNFGQQVVLSATNPDAFILCVNCSDEFDYIERTIKYVESIYESKVISLVIFPFYKNYFYNAEVGIGKRLENKKVFDICSKLENYFDIPCLVNGYKDDMNKLYNIILNYF